jgi:methylaspartate mutase epsilon subunit
MEKISVARWDEAKFNKVFRETCAQYPTGAQIDLNEVVSYHKSIPVHKNIPEMFQKARAEGRCLLTPRGGVASLPEMKRLLQYLQNEGGADILPINPDTYSRREQFEQAASGLKASLEADRSLLNGFPVVAHGVDGCRELFESVDRPIVLRSATPIQRLLVTMAIAGGCTEYVMGAASLNLCMEYDMSFESSVFDAQYTAYLSGWLHERGVKIALESDNAAALGVITTPSIAIVMGIIDLVTAAAQGAKYFGLAYAPMHNYVQDIAGMRQQKRLTQKYMEKFGYGDVTIFQDVHQWNGVFPEDRQRANGLIAVVASVAALYGEAEQMMVKTPDEGMGVPTMEANAGGLVLTRQVMNMLRGQNYPDSTEVQQEMRIIELEVDAMMNNIAEMGEGDVLLGMVRALKAGTYEFPYAVSKHVQGSVTLIRDAAGAVRFLHTGKVPFPAEVIEYNHEKVRVRQALEQREEIMMLADDLRDVRASFPVGS